MTSVGGVLLVRISVGGFGYGDAWFSFARYGALIFKASLSRGFTPGY